MSRLCTGTAIGVHLGGMSDLSTKTPIGLPMGGKSGCAFLFRLLIVNSDFTFTYPEIHKINGILMRLLNCRTLNAFWLHFK